MDHHFRPIEGYPGYRVTSKGDVLSCWSRHARPARMTSNWHTLTQIDRQGYRFVNLARGGKKQQVRIHRLVLGTFVGPAPEGMVACHGDGDRANNDLANLRWDTPKANSDDALRHGTRARGERCRSKLTEDDVLEIRRRRNEGESIAALAGRFVVTYQNILAIVSRRSWRHLPVDPARDDLKGFGNLTSQDPRPAVASC